MIQEHVGNPPGDSADEQEENDFRDRRELFFLVKYAVIYFMPVELWLHFDDTSAYDVIDELKSMFISQLRVARSEREDEFLSTKMEEQTFLVSHLAKMHGIHQNLVEDFDYWTTEEFAILGVLRSFPPI